MDVSVDLTAVLAVIAGGAIGLLGPAVAYWLRKDERRQETREQNADEQMRAWAELHDEAMRGCSSLQNAEKIPPKYEDVLHVFLVNMHLLPDDVREEMWTQLQQLGQQTGFLNIALASGVEDIEAVRNAAMEQFNEFYQLVHLRHLDAAKAYYGDWVGDSKK